MTLYTDAASQYDEDPVSAAFTKPDDGDLSDVDPMEVLRRRVTYLEDWASRIAGLVTSLTEGMPLPSADPMGPPKRDDKK